MKKNKNNDYDKNVEESTFKDKNDSKKDSVDRFEQGGMRPLTDEQLDLAIGGFE